MLLQLECNSCHIYIRGEYCNRNTSHPGIFTGLEPDRISFNKNIFLDFFSKRKNTISNLDISFIPVDDGPLQSPLSMWRPVNSRLVAGLSPYPSPSPYDTKNVYSLYGSLFGLPAPTAPSALPSLPSLHPLSPSPLTTSGSYGTSGLLGPMTSSGVTSYHQSSLYAPRYHPYLSAASQYKNMDSSLS